MPAQKRVRPTSSEPIEPPKATNCTTPTDWRERRGRANKLIWQKLRRLGADKTFITQTFRLKERLADEYKANPKAVRQFFCPAFTLFVLHAEKTFKRIAKVPDQRLRSVLQDYARYALRFGVVFVLTNKAPHFRVHLMLGGGSKFHVRVFGGNFRPEPDVEWDQQTPGSDLYAEPRLPAPSALEELIKKGVGKYVQIEDHQDTSIFKQLIDFSYDADGITFIRINADQPYVMCLIGENASPEGLWRESGRVLAQLRKELYNRSSGGRPPHVRKLVARHNKLLRRPDEPLLHKAADLQPAGTETQVFSELSTLSRMRSEFKERIT